MTTMGVGRVGLLPASLVPEGTPSIGVIGWGTVLWLSTINTALAFFLGNLALKGLKAFELSMLQNTMLIQIALPARENRSRSRWRSEWRSCS